MGDAAKRAAAFRAVDENVQSKQVWPNHSLYPSGSVHGASCVSSFVPGTHMLPAAVRAALQVVGVGSGSTVVFVIQRLAELTKQGKLSDNIFVPTSFQASPAAGCEAAALSDARSFPRTSPGSCWPSMAFAWAS
jgi:hypothetical protein